MRYLFRGRLCGFICADCPEPLANVKVRLYQSAEREQVTARAVANPKDTFAVLDDAAVKARDKLLIAEAETDAQGNFSFELGKNQKYNGEAFEVDVYCGTVPGPRAPRRPPRPRQFTITTLQPRWRTKEEEETALYSGTIVCRIAFGAISSRFWDCGRFAGALRPAERTR